MAHQKMSKPYSPYSKPAKNPWDQQDDPISVKKVVTSSYGNVGVSIHLDDDEETDMIPLPAKTIAQGPVQTAEKVPVLKSLSDLKEVTPLILEFDPANYYYRNIERPMLPELHEVVSEFYHRIGTPTQDEVDVFCEQYLIMKDRALPGKTWWVNVINEVSKKAPSKRTVGYMIGILRQRMQYGWGTSGAQEERLIIKAIEDRIGKLSFESLGRIRKMLGDFGIVSMSLSVSQVNLESTFLDALGRIASTYYESTMAKIEED